MTNTNSVPKPVMSLINGIISLAFLVSAFGVVLVGFYVVSNPLQGLLFEVPLVIFSVISGTYTVRQSAIDAQQKAIEKVRMQEAAGAEVEDGDREAATVAITPFSTLLKRNAIVALIFVPLMLVITGVAFSMIMGIMALTREVAENRTGANAMIRLLIPLPLIGWFVAVGFGWGLAARFVDRQILRIKINLPESEENRQKRQMNEALNAGRKGTSVGGCLFGVLKSIGLMLLIPLPMFLFLLLLNVPTIPEGLRIAIALPGMIIYMVGGLILLPKLLIGRIGRNFEREAQKAIAEETDPEQAAKMREEFEAYKTRSHVNENSVETRSLNRGFAIFAVMIGVVLLVGLGAGAVARMSGAGKETIEAVMAGALLLGVVVMFVGGSFIAQRFMPKTSKGEEMMVGYEMAVRTGDYGKLIPMVDEAMRKLPNWETKIPGAAAYAQAGRLEDAERITRETMREVSEGLTDVQREMRKSLMGHLFGLLAEIQFMDGKVTEAEKSVQRSLEYGDNGYAINNTAAKLKLYQRQGDAALAHIETAAKAYRAEGKPVSMYNVALRAWALALQREFAQADKLMTEAIKGTPTAHVTDLAELYWIGSYVMEAEGKHSAAVRSLEKAVSYDRYGANGMVAARELESRR